MALDFPNSPATGQQFISGNTVWQYDGVKWVAVGSALARPSNPNKLLNPFMEIDQANEGATRTMAQGGYAVDGWITAAANSGAAGNTQRVTDAPPGYPNSLKFTLTTTGSALAAGDYCQLYQIIEADELADTGFGTSAAQSLALSVWVKANPSGTYGGVLINLAQTRAYSFTIPISTANTWTLFTQLIPGDTAGSWVTSGNAGGAILLLSAAAGSSRAIAPGAWTAISPSVNGPTGMLTNFFTTAGATFQIGPCKLEVGSTATPMLRQSFQQELSRCQRYYEKSYDPGTVPGTASVQTGVSLFLLYGAAGAATVGTTIPFSVTKRASPTLTAYSSVTGAAGKARDAATNVDMPCTPSANSRSCYWTANVNTPGTTNLQLQWVADARL